MLVSTRRRGCARALTLGPIARRQWRCHADGVEVTTSAIQGTISQSGAQFQYQETESGGNVCTWTGGWTQQGVLGRVDGTVSCTDGRNGTILASDTGSAGSMAQLSPQDFPDVGLG